MYTIPVKNTLASSLYWRHTNISIADFAKLVNLFSCVLMLKYYRLLLLAMFNQLRLFSAARRYTELHRQLNKAWCSALNISQRAPRGWFLWCLILVKYNPLMIDHICFPVRRVTIDGLALLGRCLCLPCTIRLIFFFLTCMQLLHCIDIFWRYL